MCGGLGAGYVGGAEATGAARVREPGVSRVAKLIQNAGVLLASVRPLV